MAEDLFVDFFNDACTRERPIHIYIIPLRTIHDQGNGIPKLVSMEKETRIFEPFCLYISVLFKFKEDLDISDVGLWENY